MSILKNMKTNKCPHCGCDEVIYESVRISPYGKNEVLTHCNGKRWETRKFLCGHSIDFSPNFDSEEESRISHCTESESYLVLIANFDSCPYFKALIPTKIPSTPNGNIRP